MESMCVVCGDILPQDDLNDEGICYHCDSDKPSLTTWMEDHSELISNLPVTCKSAGIVLL